MPELPEVETICRGLTPHLSGQCIQNVIVRREKLRWAIPSELTHCLSSAIVQTLYRRGKYLLFVTERGTMIIHLGMSGRLRLLTEAQDIGKHDHLDIIFANGFLLRFTDPRRFGAVLWTNDPLEQHTLLRFLGVEPLTEQFHGDYLYQHARKRTTAIKTLIMNSHIVVGIGNIYANEALFMARILPQRIAQTLTLNDCQRLADSIRVVLQQAIRSGGTTLRDFVDSKGEIGYFQQQLQVYSREGKACVCCSQPLSAVRIANRATVFCSFCQH